MAFRYSVIARVVAKSKAMGDIAFQEAEEKFNEEKDNVIRKFDNSAITQELINGASDPMTENISRTLSGPKSPVGNLFSFLGFNAGTDVISPVRAALVEGWDIIKTKKFSVGRGASYKITYNFTSKINTEELRAKSKLQFENGSWLDAIEEGISGVTRYLAKLAGRSGGGIQGKGEIGGKSYTPQDYLFSFIREALNRLK